MTRKLQTLDLEFDEYCHELLRDGVGSVNFLRISNQYQFIWDACRKRCARLCLQHGADDLSTHILRNEDGTLLDVI